MLNFILKIKIFFYQFFIREAFSFSRGVVTLGSSRHNLPTHNFHKILRKIWNVDIFLFNVFFSNIGNKIVIKLSLFSYIAIINATQSSNWSVHCIEIQKNWIYLKQIKIKLCSVVDIYRFLLLELSRILLEYSVNGFYPLIIINYSSTIILWYHLVSYY